GIAHEINNPLSYLMGSLDQSRFLLASHSPDLDELRASIAEAREGAKRVRDIVAEVRKLANEPAGRDLPLQLRPMVDEVTKSLARDLANNVRLEVRVDESIVVRANDGRLKLVISHLLRNAIQSTRPGEPNRIELAAHEVGESSVVVTIRDEGRGMSEDTQRRVFDPFFSTRRGGTGLGLALCREICLQMGSALHIDSELGRGTTVSLRLVRSDEPSATRTLSAPSEIERSLRCLVVDDEPAVCRLMQRLLQNRFQVEATTSSEAALDQIRGGARFDVIVCDVSMPNLSGPELYGALEAIAPDQAAGMVFVTGGIVEEGDAAFFERTGHVFLHKPFTNDELVAEVTRAANRSATSGPKAKSLVG
ncbi:MAG: hybrid sensor histidine kinase/response regulator, partial [Myxococcales bacterium]|nr:hybrid sensor histidine kinase/response regulator [Myxococcales bacterium]